MKGIFKQFFGNQRENRGIDRFDNLLTSEAPIIQVIEKLKKKDPSLTEINFGEFSFDNDQFEEILKSLKENKNITKLGFVNKSIDDQKMQRLAEALVNNKTIKELDLSGNNITKEGAISVASILTKNQNLEKLNLENNNFHNEEANTIAEALNVNKSLKEICLKKNTIGNQGIKYLYEAIKNNESLEVLDLSSNHFDLDASEYIKNIINIALTKDKKLKKLDFTNDFFCLEANELTIGGGNELGSITESMKAKFDSDPEFQLEVRLRVKIGEEEIKEITLNREEIQKIPTKTLVAPVKNNEQKRNPKISKSDSGSIQSESDIEDHKEEVEKMTDSEIGLEFEASSTTIAKPDDTKPINKDKKRVSFAEHPNNNAQGNNIPNPLLRRNRTSGNSGFDTLSGKTPQTIKTLLEVDLQDQEVSKKRDSEHHYLQQGQNGSHLQFGVRGKPKTSAALISSKTSITAPQTEINESSKLIYNHPTRQILINKSYSSVKLTAPIPLVKIDLDKITDQNQAKLAEELQQLIKKKDLEEKEKRKVIKTSQNAAQKVFEDLIENDNVKNAKITKNDINLFIKIMRQLIEDNVRNAKDAGSKVGFAAWSQNGDNSQIAQALKKGNENTKIDEIIQKFKIISREIQIQSKGKFSLVEGRRYKDNTDKSAIGVRSYRLVQLLDKDFEIGAGK